jgi:hypothetical protein
MPTHKKARELADTFDKAYPESLPQRLRWWCQVLGIDRGRFLRLMGMSAQQAAQNKDRDWEEILEDREWQERGWWLEGKLHEILTLFHYDWKELAEYLHQPQAADGQEAPSRVARPKGKVIPLRCRPNGQDANLLLNLLAEGGPESLPALLVYLSEPA